MSTVKKILKRILPSAAIELRFDLVISSRFFRNNFIRKTIDSFGENRPSPRVGSQIRVAALWEVDGTFLWAQRADSEQAFFFIHLPRGIFDPIWRKLLKSYNQASNLGESSLENYYNPRFSGDREQFRKYCKEALTTIKQLYDIDVFLLPKLNDDWITDLIKSLRELRYPVIVNDRESISTAKRVEIYSPILKRILDFQADRLLVSSQHHKDFFVHGGYPEEGIEVIGKINYDYWFSPQHWRDGKDIHPSLDPAKKKIMFFSFGSKSYMNFFYPGETRNWDYLSQDFHDLLLWVIEEYGDKVQVLYKSGAKPHRDYFPGFDEFAKKLDKLQHRESFVSLGVSCSSLDLIRNSDLIMGFQTSGLIEAMYTKKPIYAGGWGALFEDIKDTLLPFHVGSSVNFFASPETMKADLKRLIENDFKFELSAQEVSDREKFRSFYFEKNDGKAGQRLLGELRDLAKKERHGTRK